MNQKANINIKNNKGETALILACMNKNELLVKYLMEYGDNTYFYEDNGLSPLFNDKYAISNKKIELLKYLIKIICKIKFQDKFQNSIDILAYINRKGFNICCEYENKITSLHIACYFNNDIIVSFLIQNNLNIDSQNIYGNSPVTIACYFNNFSIIQSLVEKKANIYLENNNGEMPLTIAEKIGNKKIKKYLNILNYGIVFFFLYLLFLYYFCFVYVLILSMIL